MGHDPRCDEIRKLGGERYQAFLDAGFREHYTGEISQAVFGTPFLLQKRCKGMANDHYFLNVLVFERREPRHFVIFEAEAHLNNRNGVPFKVEMLKSDVTPEEVEDFFSDVYLELSCSGESD